MFEKGRPVSNFQLLGKPLAALFNGTAQMSWSVAIVLFVSALIAFGLQNLNVGLSLVTYSAISGFAGAMLNERYNPVTSTVTILAGTTLVALTCAIVYHNGFSAKTMITSNALLLLAVTFGAMGASSEFNNSYHSATGHHNWIIASNYLYATILVLTGTLVLTTLAYVITNRHDFTVYSTWQQRRPVGTRRSTRNRWNSMNFETASAPRN